MKLWHASSHFHIIWHFLPPLLSIVSLSFCGLTLPHKPCATGEGLRVHKNKVCSQLFDLSRKESWVSAWKGKKGACTICPRLYFTATYICYSSIFYLRLLVHRYFFSVENPAKSRGLLCRYSHNIFFCSSQEHSCVGSQRQSSTCFFKDSLRAFSFTVKTPLASLNERLKPCPQKGKRGPITVDTIILVSALTSKMGAKMGALLF